MPANLLWVAQRFSAATVIQRRRELPQARNRVKRLRNRTVEERHFSAA